MKNILLLIAFLMVGVLGFSQPKMSFENKTHNFGEVKEDGGSVSASFVFKNDGDAPLILNNVRATCGCTTPEWTKDPVLPGKSGAIKVTYDPKNRPGAINKSVNVSSNAQPSVAVIKIEGKVLPREKTMEEIYPKVMSELRWKSNYLSLGTVVNSETKEGKLYLINPTDAPIELGIYRIPSYISAKFEPEVLQPGQEGVMNVSYNAAGKNSFGYVNDRIYININGKNSSANSVSVTVSINEDFSHLTPAELAKAPVAEFAEKSFDFGKINQGEKVGHDFKLTNSGKTALLIRKVTTTCGCTTANHPSTVAPGETINLHVDFNSRGRRGRQNKTITVITNDPKNSNTTLRIMGPVDVAPAVKP